MFHTLASTTYEKLREKVYPRALAATQLSVWKIFPRAPGRSDEGLGKRPLSPWAPLNCDLCRPRAAKDQNGKENRPYLTAASITPGQG
jgi:hypothetical protein